MLYLSRGLAIYLLRRTFTINENRVNRRDRDDAFAQGYEYWLRIYIYFHISVLIYMPIRISTPIFTPSHFFVNTVRRLAALLFLLIISNDIAYLALYRSCSLYFSPFSLLSAVSQYFHKVIFNHIAPISWLAQLCGFCTARGKLVEFFLEVCNVSWGSSF